MRVVALLLAMVITAITLVDPLYCADGCTRTGVAATSDSAPRGGDCPVCQPGAVATFPPLPIAAFQIAPTLPPLVQRPLDQTPLAIEHPPRA